MKNQFYKLCFLLQLFCSNMTHAAPNLIDISFHSFQGTNCPKVNRDNIKVVYSNEGLPYVTLSLPELSIKLPQLDENGDYKRSVVANCSIDLKVSASQDLDYLSIISRVEVKGVVLLFEGVFATAKISVQQPKDLNKYPEYIGEATWNSEVDEEFLLKNDYKKLNFYNSGFKRNTSDILRINIKSNLDVMPGYQPKHVDGALHLNTGNVSSEIKLDFYNVR